ncbi:hypothetical protein B0H14DRAFT_3465213 [Mycena olivaceomarginata]|nr:hypothetical protein B0H14DRAFT_3465213 [Mycena olivaceomarginata]
MSSPPGLTFEELLANLSLDDGLPQSPPAPATSAPTSVRVTPVPVIPAPVTPPYHSYPHGVLFPFTHQMVLAGTATQGVAGRHVHRVQTAKKKKTKKAAYVVFHGWAPNVYRKWADARLAVSGCSNSIHHGYSTVAEAEAAFSYARSRGWTRTKTMTVVNPLHGTEDLDNTWFIVYRGIKPGVYHSLLEALLNTTGVSNSLYQAEPTKEAAFRRYRTAVRRGEVMTAAALLPPFCILIHLAFKDNFPIAARACDVVFQSDLTPHQLKVVKHKERNEKARVRIAKKRAELKTLAPDVQEAYIEKARGYKAKYRETHCKALAMKTEVRRRKIYKEQYGMKALVAKCRREHVDSGDEDLEFDKDPDLYSRENYM